MCKRRVDRKCTTDDLVKRTYMCTVLWCMDSSSTASLTPHTDLVVGEL